MVEHSDDDEEVADRLRQLPREIAPPARVGVAIARAIAPRRRARGAWIAVAASLIAGAFMAGRMSGTPPRATGEATPTFAFLLYGGGDGSDTRVAEYRDWALTERRRGRMVTGERLDDEAWNAGVESGVDPLPLRGFFLVQARDPAEALALARQHPHASSGTVIVRRLAGR
jgi:hypothetical protein